MIALVSTSIIMLPYCRSLWQKPISRYPSDNNFSSVSISSSRLSKPKFLVSFGEHKLLAWLSHFLVNNKRRAFKILHYNKMDKIDIVYNYLILCQSWTFFGPGIRRLWNSLILEAIKADISGSRRSAAERV